VVVKALDVVTRTREHQSNLVPVAVRSQTALVALPPPLVCRLLEPAELERLRSRRLELHARRLGLGNGPCPIVDLQVDRRSIETLLVDLETSCVRNIALFGAADQPGFARAIAFRWPFGLELLLGPDGNMLDRPSGASGGLALERLSCGDDPLRNDIALGPDATAGAGAGLVPDRALFGHESALRDAWLEKWSRHGIHSEACRAMLGIDEELERRLCSAAPELRPERGRVVAIAGLDGAGKSSHAARLVANCRAAGLSSRSVKLYRQGAFLELADQISARTRAGARLSNFRLSRIVKLVDSLRVLRNCMVRALENGELLVMDRYVETHQAAALSQLGWDISQHPIVRCFPEAERTIWLDLPIELAQKRLSTRARALSADEHPTGLLGYSTEYARMSEQSRWFRLDARAAFSENARVIDQALELPHLCTDMVDSDHTTSPGVDSSRREPCRLTIGSSEERLLGEDSFGLRRFVQQRLGAAAGGVPESFWIEAYALDVALELRSGPPCRGALSVWPEALARMAVFRDLDTLSEVSRLIESHVEIVGWSTRGAAAWFAELCPHPAPQARLLHDYEIALTACARARGWPRECDLPAPRQPRPTRIPLENVR
jgi:thymidylate kinase